MPRLKKYHMLSFCLLMYIIYTCVGIIKTELAKGIVNHKHKCNQELIEPAKSHSLSSQP